MMMTGFTAVLLYLIWTQALTLLYAFPRVPQALLGMKPLNAWERDQPNNDPAFLQRAKAAHLNCVENFALFLAVVVIAALMNKSAVVDAVAAYVLLARVGQSVVHIIGTAMPLVLIRATFFLTQLGLIFYVALQLLK
jgi:uncharacterized MAPEG superfamily protein